jgi:hypothetical protein
VNDHNSFSVHSPLRLRPPNLMIRIAGELREASIIIVENNL